jgi:hypothetical protein
MSEIYIRSLINIPHPAFNPLSPWFYPKKFQRCEQYAIIAILSLHAGLNYSAAHEQPDKKYLITSMWIPVPLVPIDGTGSF